MKEYSYYYNIYIRTIEKWQVKKIGCIAVAKIYTAVQTFRVRKMFYVFDAYAYQGCLQKRNIL